MKTFEQQLREYVSKRNTGREPYGFIEGAELLLPMVVEMFEVSRLLEKRWYAQNRLPITSIAYSKARKNLEDTLESIQKKIEVQK